MGKIQTGYIREETPMRDSTSSSAIKYGIESSSGVVTEEHIPTYDDERRYSTFKEGLALHLKLRKSDKLEDQKEASEILQALLGMYI